MANEVSVIAQHQKSYSKDYKEFVSMRLAGQLFGVSVEHVQDVLRLQKIASVPRAPEHIRGLLNLRGRIVTVIDMRVLLSLPEEKSKDAMMIVIERDGELYSLVVDSVGAVLSLEEKDFDSTPPNISSSWHRYASGVYRLDDELMVVLDTMSLIPKETIPVKE